MKAVARGLLLCLACAAVSPANAGETAPAAAERFRALLERPLFAPSRRPPPPAVVPVAAMPIAPPPPLSPPPPDFSLSGVILGGGGGVALLRRPQDPAPVRVMLGGDVDGWRLAELRAREVVLRRDDRSVTVSLPVAAH